MKGKGGRFGKYLPQVLAAAALALLTEVVKLLGDYMKRKGGGNVEKKEEKDAQVDGQ